MNIRIDNPTRRRTECRLVSIGRVKLYFSYETLIGVDNGCGSRKRVTNTWGSTTGRHFNECGLQDAEVISADELSQFVRASLLAETRTDTLF